MKHFVFVAYSLAMLIVLASEVAAQTFSVPVRWCAVEGSPAAETPELFNDQEVEDPDTDLVLWRRHERATDIIYLPQADITFRSAIWSIVEDADLSFPIIEDPCDPAVDACAGETGDILTPVDNADTTEWNDLYNACVAAWSDPDGGLDGGNIGIVVVNVRRLVDSNGDRNFGGYTLSAGPGSDTFIAVEDFAFRSPDATDGTFELNSWRDDVGFILGHEAGHRLGIGHVCDSNNIMDFSGIDRTVEAGNFEIGEVDALQSGGSTDCDNGAMEQVDQVADVRQSAENVPGCKIFGTNQDCTNISDVVADAVGDVPVRFVDMSLVYVTESSDGTSSFEHQLHGPIENAGGFSELSYYVFADLDNDTATGGAATELAVLDEDIDFVGVDLITRVRISQGQEGSAVVQGAMWRWTDGAFVAIEDDSIKGRLRQRFGHGGEPAPGTATDPVHIYDVIAIEFSTDLRGPVDKPFRIQAMAVGVTGEPTDLSKFIDILDGQGGTGVPEEGRPVILVSPTFPTCVVLPETAEPDELVSVKVQGLLAKKGVHVVFGDHTVATGETDFSGNATIFFPIPANTSGGTHLVTVGSDGTALTADCPAVVRSDRGKPGTDRPRTFKEWCFLCLAVIGLLGIVLLLVVLIVFFLVRRRG